MSEMVPMLASGVITGLSAAIGSYAIIRHTKNEMKKELEAWINSERGREAVYSIGILLGRALASGSGMDKVTKSSGGLKGLIMQGIASFIQSKVPIVQQPEQQQPQY